VEEEVSLRLLQENQPVLIGEESVSAVDQTLSVAELPSEPSILNARNEDGEFIFLSNKVSPCFTATFFEC